MAMRHMVAAAVLGMACVGAHAAVIAPVNDYVKPDEPITVKFLTEKGEDGKKALVTLGADATKIESLFAAAPANAVIGGDGAPLFTAYTVTGEAIKPAAGAKAAADGSVDLGAFFPQLKDTGTYYIVWNDAAPLVVETMRNGIPWGVIKDEYAPGSLKTDLQKQYMSGPPVVLHLVQAECAVITTDKGVIKAKFSYDMAPHTIDNFVSLARQGFYEHSAFHRIMKGFMIQGGDSLANSPDRAGTGGPGYDIAAELNDKKHIKGVLSMARTGVSVDTAGGQFFIMHDKSAQLDGGYTAFGDVIEGLGVVDTIAATPSAPGSGAVDAGQRPKIISVQIVPATAAIYGLKK